MKINWAAAAVIVTVVLAAIGGSWTLYTYLNPPPPPPELTATIDYQVCRGSQESQCKPHNAFIGCGSIIEWAKSRCKEFLTTMQDQRSGGACGYSVTKVTCTVKK
jgi:hypothetical protein